MVLPERWHVALQESLVRLGETFGTSSIESGEVNWDAVEWTLGRLTSRLEDNYPYGHPLYIGQMMKPPHPVAWLAYTLAMSINPNNHALDGGRASSAMEKEAVSQIAAMFGWKTHLGHLCSGGTFANLEALWVGRECQRGRGIAASAQAHYTHARLAGVLGMRFHSIAVDCLGRMDLSELERVLAREDVGLVVATAGTTAAGAVDSIDAIAALRDRHGFRLHVDAAYGGYFLLVEGLSASTQTSMARMREADSIAIDPHKHGLQPYGCGCILFRDPAVGRFYQHDSPYTYFSSEELHLGEISLECSRSGSSAAALWATLAMLPLRRGGAFARDLARGRAAALALYRGIEESGRLVPLFAPELDIVTWTIRARSASESSRLARQLFDEAARRDLHLALARFPRGMVSASGSIRDWDSDEVLGLRACVMKPEHLDWMPEILRRLGEALDAMALPVRE